MKHRYANFCDCSDYDDTIINDLKTNKNNFPESIQYLLNMINDDDTLKPYEKLEQEGKDLIEWCVDFLIYQKQTVSYPDIQLKSEYKETEPHKYKYITIWSFIFDFLKIGKCGQDYLVLNFLEWYNIMEHGSGIRCGWYIKDNEIYGDRKLSSERKKIIENWIINAPDEW